MMPTLNVHHKQPAAALWYSCLGSLLGALFMLAFGLVVVLSGVVSSTVPALTPEILVGAIFLVGLAVTAYPILYYLLFSYQISDHSLTIHSGIIFRQHETIHFSRIQTIDNERGPLLWIFGLTLLEVWTASPDQVLITPKGRTHPRPDATILLGKDTAAQVKDFILNRPSTHTL